VNGVYANLKNKSQVSEILAETTSENTVTSTEGDKFEETLALSVFEGLSWVNNLVAPVLHSVLSDAMAPEIGLRKVKLSMRDAKILEESLEKIFGFGARVVEYKILQILFTKLELDEAIKQDFKFSDEVKNAMRLYKTKIGTNKGPAIRK
jgi:hypothetical protein